MAPPSLRVARLAAPLFVLSGASSLIYQVVWQRVLALASGVGVVSVSIIVGAFMLGLGLGSEAGGRMARRLRPRQALLGFAAAEGFLAVFGVLSGWLYYELLYQGFPGLFDQLAIAALVEIVALLPPTFAMGLSLPLLVRACVTDDAGAARTVARLYGINVLGAAAGALGTPWLLLRHVSMVDALRVAATMNAAVALGALALARRMEEREEALTNTKAQASATSAAPGPTAGDSSFRLWVLLYAASGFLALGLEMVWFRVADVVLKSTAYTFGTVLGLYLLGVAAGTFAGRRDLRRSPLATFLALEAVIGIWAIGAILALCHAPETWPFMPELIDSMKEYRGQLGPGAEPSVLARNIDIPSFLFLVPTLTIGLAFLALQSSVQMSADESPRRTGLLQAANILGSLAGSLIIGLAALASLGTAGTLRALGGLSLAFAVLGWRRFGAALFGPPVALLAGLVALIPDNATLWKALHGRADARTIVAEDASSVVALTRSTRGAYRVSVNGFGHSRLPFGGIHSVLGAMPLVWHPSPRHIAIVGLGSGNTAWAALGRLDVERVVVYEIARPQLPALEALRRRNEYPALEALLGDPRMELRLSDGRHGLATREETFDAIEIDALYPFVAWSGNIYSREFFELCRRRLRPGGLLVAWAPTPRILRTIESVFPEIRVFPDNVVVASMTSLPAAPDLGRLNAGFGYRFDDEFRQGLSEGRPSDRRPGDVNRDLDPRDEFSRR